MAVWRHLWRWHRGRARERETRHTVLSVAGELGERRRRLLRRGLQRIGAVVVGVIDADSDSVAVVNSESVSVVVVVAIAVVDRVSHRGEITVGFAVR